MATTKTAAAIIARGTANAAFTQLTGCSVTRTGTTATLTKTSHGRSNGEKLLIQNFELEEFNGIITAANVTANTLDYTIKQDPGANPAGATGTLDLVTLGTALDLSTSYGGNMTIGLQNHNTGPTIAPEVWMGIAIASAEADYIWRRVWTGNTTANSLIVSERDLPMGVMYVNFAVGRNTGQPVDCFALASHVTAI